MPLKKKAKRIVKKKTKKVIRKRAIKKAIKKTSKKKTLRIKTKVKTKIKGNIIGVITHYFPHVRAAVIKLKAPLSVGDTIKIKGHTTNFTQTIDSLQIDRAPINSAKKGQEIGLLVNSRVRQHDVVCKP